MPERDNMCSAPACRRTGLYIGYVLLVGLPLAGILLFVAGPLLHSSYSGVAGGSAKATATFSILTFILELAVILAAARLAGLLFRYLGQPTVVGEMLAGILLGPSSLGAIAPGLSALLFPAAAMPFLNTLSQLGLMMFMFLVGLKLNFHELRHRARAALLVSHVSIALPMFLGVAIAAPIYSRAAPPGVPLPAFALFMGVAMSITAFPVLARILADRDLLGTPAGSLAIAAAAVDDVTGWCLLGVVIALVRGAASGHPIWITLIGLIAFIAVMILFVTPMLQRAFGSERSITDSAIAGCILLALICGAATEFLGIHLLFGSFLAGVVMPRRPNLTEALGQRLGTLTSVLLLPIFFAFAGLRTQIGLLQNPEMWTWTSLVIVAAIAGKLGGSTMAACAAGIPVKEALAVGTLMNTRGLMELVALNIGLEAGVISTAIYTMLMLMALFTTMMTGPILSVLLRPALERLPAPDLGRAIRHPDAGVRTSMR